MMKIFLLLCLVIFYLFFFLRASLLSRKIGKSVRGRSPLIIFSVFFAGVSSLEFALLLISPTFSRNIRIIDTPQIIDILAAVFIFLGLTFSIISSLSLQDSWRIGIDKDEKTELIINGAYAVSRNPYFLSFDLVLIGMVLFYPGLFLIIPAIIAMVLFHFLVLQEEKYLLAVHGGKYLDYKKQTRRYL